MAGGTERSSRIDRAVGSRDRLGDVRCSRGVTGRLRVRGGMLEARPGKKYENGRPRSSAARSAHEMQQGSPFLRRLYRITVIGFCINAPGTLTTT